MNKFYEVFFDDNGPVNVFEVRDYQIPEHYKQAVLQHGYAEGQHVLFLRQDSVDIVSADIREKILQKEASELLKEVVCEIHIADNRLYFYGFNGKRLDYYLDVERIEAIRDEGTLEELREDCLYLVGTMYFFINNEVFCVNNAIVQMHKATIASLRNRKIKSVTIISGSEGHPKEDISLKKGE